KTGVPPVTSKRQALTTNGGCSNGSFAQPIAVPRFRQISNKQEWRAHATRFRCTRADAEWSPRNRGRRGDGTTHVPTTTGKSRSEAPDLHCRGWLRDFERIELVSRRGGFIRYARSARQGPTCDRADCTQRRPSETCSGLGTSHWSCITYLPRVDTS